MRRCLVVAVAGIGLCGALVAGERAPLRIAVVDIGRVFNLYRKTGKVKQLMSGKFDARAKALETRKKELIDRERKLREDTRPANDPEAVKQRQQYINDRRAFETEALVFEREFAQFNLKHTKEIMVDIEAAVRRYAEKKGYDLVLKYQPAQEEARSKIQLMTQVGDNPVLYFVSSIDITEGIVTLLNLAYDQGKSLVPKERSATEK